MEQWKPSDPFSYCDFYSKTPPLPSVFNENRQLDFVGAWNSSNKFNGFNSVGIEIVFVRGLFGRLMINHFRTPLKELSALGFKASIVKNYISGSTPKETPQLRQHIKSKCSSSNRLIFLAHSKGGLDTLSLLAEDEALRNRTAGVVLVQTPRGPSPVIESILQKKHRGSAGRRELLKEMVFAQAMKAFRLDEGCLSLTHPSIVSILSKIDAIEFKFPVLAVSSWSLTPTSWLDSFHLRLGQIRDLSAHDGQFYIEDQLWPQFQNILLREVDHAQPVVGGLGFDHGNLWKSLLLMLVRSI